MCKFFYCGIFSFTILFFLFSALDNEFIFNNGTRYYICEIEKESFSNDIKTGHSPNSAQDLDQNLRRNIKKIAIILSHIEHACLNYFINNNNCWKG